MYLESVCVRQLLARSGFWLGSYRDGIYRRRDSEIGEQYLEKVGKRDFKKGMINSDKETFHDIGSHCVTNADIFF